jgi:hypothetical protein
MRQFRPVIWRSSAALREHAAAYRRMATAARTMDVVAALFKLADRLEHLADQREQMLSAAPHGSDRALSSATMTRDPNGRGNPGSDQRSDFSRARRDGDD